MKGDKIRCIIDRSSNGDYYEYSLYVRPENTDNYFDIDMIDDIKEQIDEQLENCLRDGATELLLVEDGESEDVFWHRYFNTISIKKIIPEDM